MLSLRPTVCRLLAWAAFVAPLAGCGTTKWSDSPRTATEQLLVSDAIDRAISEIDFSALADKSVYLDTRYIITTLDQNYLTSTLRQHMLASGCIVKDKPDEASYVVEVRTGSLGTNRQDLLFGVPATNLPTAGLLPIGSASIPEIALVKRTNQQGVCKVAVFAYDRMSGRPVWQSGNRKIASRAKDIWVMGTGPFQRGTIYEGTVFGGEKLEVPLVGSKAKPENGASVGRSHVFTDQFADQAEPERIENAGYVTRLPKDNQAQAASATGAGPPVPAPVAAPASSKPAEAPATPKAAYTPPLPPPMVVPPPIPPPVAQGLQGNLTPTPLFAPNANPAAATASALQTINAAKDLFRKDE